MSSQNFKYPQCEKGDYHVGEILNLVCLEPKCIQKSIICGICYDEEHKTHKIKPLKVIINSSKKYLQGLTPMNLDTNKIKASATQSKTKLLQAFDTFEKYVHDSMSNIRTNINAIFIKIIDQIELKTGKNEELINALEGLKSTEMKYDEFTNLMKKLLAGVPLEEEEEEEEVSGEDIEKSIQGIQQKLEKQLKGKQTKITKQIEAFSNALKHTAENPSIFDTKIDFKFSNELKHTGVTVTSQTLIKSTQAYNYRFSLMEPSLQQKGNKPCKVCFKVRQNISNWLGVGVCYKNTIQANNYTFNYSTLGHGGYLISSNGGSWSSANSSHNNVVTSFNFAKDDVIIIEYDPNESKVVFRKKGTEENHTLEIDPKDDDELYLCGLFYYNNDEIEYLGYDQ